MQLVLILLLLVRTVCSYQLLFLPLSERTHMLVHLKLATVLAQRGHNVTYITAECHDDFARKLAAGMAPSGTLQFLTYSMDCSYHEREKAAARLLTPLGEVAAIYKNVVGRADAMLSNPSLMQQLEQLAPQTDLLVSDIFSFGMLLAAKLGLQHVDIDVGTAGSLWEPVLYGAETADSYVPAVGSFFPTTGMSIWQRAANSVMTFVIRTLIRAAFWAPSFSLQQVVSKHSIPIQWPYTHTMLLLVNSNFAIEPPRAIPPNTQYIGPILPEPPAQLPADLEAFVSADGAEGAVLLSFGGTLQAPLEASQALATVMEALPAVRFVWKLSQAEQAALAASTNISQLSNVFISDWLPQNDLLGHPKVRAFITQGGYLSMSEAAYHGVPVLGLPFIPGQGELIRFAWDQGRAIYLPAKSLRIDNTAAVIRAVKELLNNESYHAAAQVVSRRLQASKRPYKEAAADWIEYTAAVKDDGPFLHPVKLQQHWYQQVLLDVMALQAAAALLLCLAARVVWRRVKRHSGGYVQDSLHLAGGQGMRQRHTRRPSNASSSCGSSSSDDGGRLGSAQNKATAAVMKLVPRAGKRPTPASRRPP